MNVSPDTAIDELTMCMSLAGCMDACEYDIHAAAGLLRDAGVGELAADVITMAAELAAAGYRQSPDISTSARDAATARIEAFALSVRDLHRELADDPYDGAAA
jgi:uncharacterized protein YfiM (DUF2279 family)